LKSPSAANPQCGTGGGQKRVYQSSAGNAVIVPTNAREVSSRFVPALYQREI